MRIPPYYEKGSWQRFFAGGVIGAIISWIIFAYMYGTYQDTQILWISKQAEEIKDLKKDIQIWQEDYKKLNEENQKGLTLQEIDVTLTNGDKYKMDKFRTYQLETLVKQEVNHLIAKDITKIYESRELIKRAVENRVFTIDDKQYRLEVRGIYVLYETLEIDITMKFNDES
ncbi:sporulation membrane protein YtrI [Bacillus pinisoli]|uniref:sporulation membrane protein YtrI n=1 Tax=Bacillus pinisoli TaxID=2901866 RepID=UPI001FF642DD|nr:sporulation membrane protein YtrI [Bacillus pinisoli]